MEYYHNPGKALEIEVAGERYLRHGIRTHFVEVGEDYLDLFRRYVVPVYRPGDWVAVSEKVAALCQGRVIHRQEIQVTWLARLLAKCVRQTPAGPGMGLPVKMQFALDQEGRARVLWAALRAGLDKLRGIHGTFYRLLGPEVRGLDGFYGEDIPAYADLGIRIPTEPDLLCDQVYEKTGVQSYIVDANGLGVDSLSDVIVYSGGNALNGGHDDAQGSLSDWESNNARYRTWKWYNEDDIPVMTYIFSLYEAHNCIPGFRPLMWDFLEHYSVETAADGTVTRYYSASGFEQDDAVVIQ